MITQVILFDKNLLKNILLVGTHKNYTNLNLKVTIHKQRTSCLL